MAKVVLAGYKDTEQDRAVKEHYESLGHDVQTYNQLAGMADSTNIYAAARGAAEIVNMSKDMPDNHVFHRLICRVAGENGATVSRRSK